ncbi:MAG: NAD-dependent epimerase/dehydratase family protein [Bacteroidales bacterium]|jgi:nucleoside-diphosphate-sugar epimerase|nr:NAD-dependent epimerase/dehydratase family protein [Bacteroidales bacterium]
MIIVTGAAGFIGSCMLSKLNNKGFKDIVLVDDFSKTEKVPNTLHKCYHEKVERILFFEWLSKHSGEIDFIFHLGARTDTTEFNMAIFEELNLNFSKKLWEMCTQCQIPLIYASSAATYGDGTLGYDDRDPDLSFRLLPLNPYGISKNEFDKWVLQQTDTPPRWYGLKFFNVYGPNEYHKGRMASVVFHAFRQISDTGYKEQDTRYRMQDTRYKIQDAVSRIQDTGYKIQDAGCRIQDTGYKIQDAGSRIQDTGYKIQDEGSRIQDTGYKIQDEGAGTNQPASGIRHPASVKLFRSHNPNYKDGEQLRDFIYVKDVTDVMYFLMNHTSETKPHHLTTSPSHHLTSSPSHHLTSSPSAICDSGIYNLGTGKARTFLDLVKTVFTALDKPPNIEFIDTPIDIRDKYQYFTEAPMQKLQAIGYSKPFYTLEAGIEEYVQGYLVGNTCY